MGTLAINEIGNVGRGQFMKELKSHIVDLEFYTKEKILMDSKWRKHGF